MVNTIDIQRAILSSYLNVGNETLNGIEIKNKWFTIPLHTLIVKCVSWLLEKDLEVNENTVLYYIAKNNQVDMQEWLYIMAQNPFATERTIRTYSLILNEDIKRAAYDI